LRPDGNPEQLDWLIRMKQHPDSQPGRAKTMESGHHNPGDADKQFYLKWIDLLTLPCATDALQFSDAKQTRG
jgi:hypothetical protein